MTTVNYLMRYISKDNIGDYGHGAKAIERSCEKAPAGGTTAAVGQELCRGGGEHRGGSANGVHVEAVSGRVGVEGHLEDTTILSIPHCEHSGDTHIFEREYIPEQTGRLGYAVRISPNHSVDPLTQPCNSNMKWA